MSTIYVWIGANGRVTTSHALDYKGYDLAACLREIEADEDLPRPRWVFGVVDGTVCLQATVLD